MHNRRFQIILKQVQTAGRSQRALSLIDQLESECPMNPPSVSSVFRLYCIEEMTIAKIARRCRCEVEVEGWGVGFNARNFTDLGAADFAGVKRGAQDEFADDRDGKVLRHGQLVVNGESHNCLNRLRCLWACVSSSL